MAFFSSEGATHYSCNPSQLSGGSHRAKIFFSWSNLRSIYKTAANRKELRSSLRHFYIRPAVFCVTCVVACVLAEWRSSALPFCSLGIHSPETNTHLGVLTVPSGGLQSHLQVVFVQSLCLHSCSQVSGNGCKLRFSAQNIANGIFIKAIQNQEHLKDQGGQPKRKRAKVRESSSPKSEHDSELSWEKGSQRDEECGEK